MTLLTGAVPAAASSRDGLSWIEARLPAPQDQALRLPVPHAEAVGEAAAPFNVADWLLARARAAGDPGRVAVQGSGLRLTHAQLDEDSARWARWLRQVAGVRPGDRVLLRSRNHPWLLVAWLAVVRAGGVVITTMPLLRTPELQAIRRKAEPLLALVQEDLLPEALAAGDGSEGGGWQVLRLHPSTFVWPEEAATASEARAWDVPRVLAGDPCLIAFTSGSTGEPKATVHRHQDVQAIVLTWGHEVLQAHAGDVFCGSPALGFTYGLGGLLLFPLAAGARVVLLERVTPAGLLQAMRDEGVSVCFSSPTAYRGMTAHLAGAPQDRPPALRVAVSAGEPLGTSTREQWQAHAGVPLWDGLGSTELLHIVIGDRLARPGVIGAPVKGFQAAVLDDDGRWHTLAQVAEAGQSRSGRLGVRGPTACLYLDDPRQRDYVREGWNLTGDQVTLCPDGTVQFGARVDDLIISSGYNIAAPEVEDALLQDPRVREAAVTGVADEARGQLVTAWVVPADPAAADADPQAFVLSLQQGVKARIAPFKYPRRIHLVAALPRTDSGKVQRHRLGRDPLDKECS